MEYAAARQNMIARQVRPWEVLDQRTLNLLQTLHREDFIPEPYRALALADVSLPLPHGGQITMPPRVEARIIQSLAPRARERALESGTGCGYLTALLAKSCAFVYSVDIYPEFTRRALEKLQNAGLRNIELATRDGSRGWAEHAPYDIIAVTGSLPALPACFQEQLKPGGRLFAVTGVSPVMQAALITRVDEYSFTREVLFETDLPPLQDAAEAKEADS